MPAALKENIRRTKEEIAHVYDVTGLQKNPVSCLSRLMAEVMLMLSGTDTVRLTCSVDVGRRLWEDTYLLLRQREKWEMVQIGRKHRHRSKPDSHPLFVPYCSLISG